LIFGSLSLLAERCDNVITSLFEKNNLTKTSENVRIRVFRILAHWFFVIIECDSHLFVGQHYTVDPDGSQRTLVFLVVVVQVGGGFVVCPAELIRAAQSNMLSSPSFSRLAQGLGSFPASSFLFFLSCSHQQH
jgi:hypothetical protein